MANTLYRFIDRAKQYIGDMLAMAYFSEFFSTYDTTLPFSTRSRVAYYFPKDMVDDAGGDPDSAMIGLVKPNGVFETLTPIGVPNSGTIVSVNHGGIAVEAVLFTPITAGDFHMTFSSNAYAQKADFFDYIKTRISTTILISDITNFVSSGNEVWCNFSSDFSFLSNAFTASNQIVEIIDAGGQVLTCGDYTFQNCTALTKLVLLNCTAMGDFCCKGMVNCTQISAASLLTAGESCFEGCSANMAIYFPLCTGIGISCFSGNTACSAFYIPSLTTIPDNAFKDCTQATAFTFATVSSVGDYAFENCTSATSFSLAVCTITGLSAFKGCTGATTFTIPNLVTAGNSSFENCTSATGFNLPKLDIAGDACFRNCTSATTFNVFTTAAVVPNGTAGISCFQACTAATSFHFVHLLSAGENCFKSCTSATLIQLDNCDTLGDSCFHSCTNATTIDIISVLNCGTTTGNDGVFFNCTFSGLTIYINVAISTDDDITDAQTAGATIVV